MTTKLELMQVIRKHCLACCDGSWKEVEQCSAFIPPNREHRCALYPYRLGMDPNPNKGNVERGKRFGFDKKSAEQEEDEGT